MNLYKGILLTENNSPINMGTYNYCSDQKDSKLHQLLDVIPYKVLGNTPDESSKYPGEDAKAQNGNNFKENIDAQNHRAMELSRNVQSENTQNLG